MGPTALPPRNDVMIRAFRAAGIIVALANDAADAALFAHCGAVAAAPDILSIVMPK